jgi:hypothetical protein
LSEIGDAEPTRDRVPVAEMLPDVSVPVTVGDADNTTEPVPVEVVVPVPPLATANVPERVNVPELVIGPPLNESPVVPPLAFTDVTVPVDGVVHIGVAPAPADVST